MSKPQDKDVSRRDFLGLGVQAAACVAVGGALAAQMGPLSGEDLVWQIDPAKCVQCGNCATHCVLEPSAVKCAHAIEICGYCKPCFGFFRRTEAGLDTGAENELCPTGAIRRRHVEAQFHEYTIDEDKCIGCGRCAKGCRELGNGSLYLQVRHDRCINCSQCAIAEACPANAFVRVPASTPYIRPKVPQP